MEKYFNCRYVFIQYDSIQNAHFNSITDIHTYTCHYIFLHLDKYIDYNQNAEHF